MTGDHWNSNRSRFRTGEPEDHFRAKNHIADLLNSIVGYDVHMEYPLVDPMFRNINYKHNYDIVAFAKVIVVEVDDPDLHSKPRKVRNDRVARNRAEEKFPNSLQFIRLDKDEVNFELGNPDLSSGYIEKNLWDKIDLGIDS